MTTLYRPVPIKSAEQAEALPEGTIWPHVDYFTGWTALVPVEAEEETRKVHGWAGTHIPEDQHQVRYTTPWEAS